MANYGELGYLLNQRRAGMGSPGAASLGYLLGGGGQAQQQMIFNRSALEGARMQDVLAQARQRQQAGIEHDNQMAARARISGRYRSSDPELADMFDAFNDPEKIAMARENLQKAAAMKQALDVANAPTVDYNHLNAIKMATAAGPTQLVRSLGDGSYTGNAYRTDPTIGISDIGKAFIGEKNAQAGAANASASEHYAQAGAAKALQDQRAGKAPNAAKSKPFTVGELSAAFGDGQHIDPDKFTRFQAYRKNAPSDTDAFLQMHDDDQQAAQGMGPPSDLAPPKPGIFDSISSLFGGGNQAAQPAASAKPSLQDWMTKAKQANPGVSDADLTAFYNKKYGG